MPASKPPASATEPTAPEVTGASRVRRSRLKDAMSLAAFVLVAVAARSSLADHYYVPTGSMIPTVEIGDRVVVSKLSYGLRLPFADAPFVSFGDPQAGDVVVLRSPEDGKTLLKRMVAGPGDVVAVQEGRIWINDRPIPIQARQGELVELLGRAHPVRLTRGGGMDFGPVRVGRDEFLVMGDNRGESHDGRAFGLVRREAIFGRALSVWMRQGRPCWHPL